MALPTGSATDCCGPNPQYGLQPFAQKSRTPTVAKLFQIGLCGVVEADLALFCNYWSAGFLGERLYNLTMWERPTTPFSDRGPPPLWSTALRVDFSRRAILPDLDRPGRQVAWRRGHPPTRIISARFHLASTLLLSVCETQRAFSHHHIRTALTSQQVWRPRGDSVQRNALGTRVRFPPP